MRQHLVGRERRAGDGNDERDAAFAPHRVGHPDHSGRLDERMQAQRVLDLGGGDVLAARDEDVLEPIDDAEHAARVARHQVAGAQPVAAHGTCRRGGVAEVAGEDARPSHPELSGRLALEGKPRRGIDDTHAHVRIRPSHRAPRAEGLRRRKVQDVRRRLGQPVALRQGDPACPPRVLQRRRHGRTAHQREAEGRDIRRPPLPIGGEQGVLRRHAHHRGHASIGDELQHTGRLERALEHDGRAHPPGEQRLAVPRGDVELREHRQHDVVLRERQRLREGEVVPEAVRVGEHDALRGRLAARREDHEQRVVVVHRPSRCRLRRARDGCLDPGGAEDRSGRRDLGRSEGLSGEGGVLVLDEDERGGGAGEHVGELAGRQPPGQRHQGDSREGAGEERHDVVGRVARQRGDAIAGPVARVPERLGEVA